MIGLELMKEGSTKLGLCATLLANAPSSIDAWRTIWGIGV